MGNNVCQVVQVEKDFVKTGSSDFRTDENKNKSQKIDNPQIQESKIRELHPDMLKINLTQNEFNTNMSFRKDRQVILTDEDQQSTNFSKINTHKKQITPPGFRMKNNLQYLNFEGTARFSETSETLSKSNSVSFFMLQSILSEEMFALIQLHDPRFFKKYIKRQICFQFNQMGFYQFYLTEFFGLFFNQNYFYQGNFTKNDSSQIIPSLTGTYITPKGKYIGQFKQGYPNGKGKYYQYSWQKINYQNLHNQDKKQIPIKFERKPQNITVYDGDWKKGCFIKGTIQSQKIKFKGEVKNGKPHGFGKLVFKKTKDFYEGNFKNGLFDGQNCIYETQKYKYTGGFSKGKKNGKGILQIKQKYSKNKKLQKMLSQKYEGIWKNDRLYQYLDISSIKK